jgi:hypothetical protein
MKMINFLCPRRFRVQHILQQWSCLDQSPSGILLVVEPDYLPNLEVLYFSVVFIPHEDFTPQKYVHSSMRGSAEGGYPLCGVQGRSPRNFFWLVKVYCNFIVNLDCSL